MNNDSLCTVRETKERMDGVDGAMMRGKGSEEESLKEKSRMATSEPGLPFFISVTLVFSTWS